MDNNVFMECFSELKDNRYKNKQHMLLDIVAICICGIMSGMKDFIEIHEFALAQKHWFEKYLMLQSGIPSHDTLERVIASLEPKVFNRLLS